MFRSLLTLLYFLVFSVSVSVYAEQNEDGVVWATENFPPFYVLNGKLKNQGIVDQLISIISQHIPDYNHSKKIMPILRIVDELNAGSQIVCASFLYDPDIEEFAIYSDPIFIVPPKQLILRRETWKRMGHPVNYSLAKLVSSGNATLGLSIGRNYGDAISKILNNGSQNHASIYYRSGDHFIGLAEMLQQGRLDATIGYSGEARFYLQESSNTGTLVSIPIIENLQPLPVYAVMPKTRWGLKFREIFNQALSNAKKDPAFRQAMMGWFEDSPEFTKALDNILDVAAN